MKLEINSEETAGRDCSSHVLFALRLDLLRNRTNTAMWACALAVIAANTGSEFADIVIRSVACLGMGIMWWIEGKVRKLIEEFDDCYAKTQF